MPSAVWKGTLAFGLVSVPVRLFRAARAERMKLRQVRRSQPAPPEPSTFRKQAFEPEPEESEPETVTPVYNAPMVPGVAEPLESSQVVKGFEYEPQQYVVLEPEEMRQLRVATSRELEILEFVKLDEIDPIYYETSYYVAPDRHGEKPYALLYEGLRQTGYLALGRIAMHGREHVALVRPGRRGLVLHTMFFEPEIRSGEEYTADLSAVSAKELELARTFVHALAAPFDSSKYKDTYRERLETLIDQKIGGRETAVEESAPRKAAVVDIMDALKKSIAAARKPVQNEPKPAKAAPRRKRA
jgi:DNA end-binding protein Ku